MPHYQTYPYQNVFIKIIISIILYHGRLLQLMPYYDILCTLPCHFQTPPPKNIMVCCNPWNHSYAILLSGSQTHDVCSKHHALRHVEVFFNPESSVCFRVPMTFRGRIDSLHWNLTLTHHSIEVNDFPFPYKIEIEVQISRVVLDECSEVPQMHNIFM